MVVAPELTLPILIGGGIIDSISPCVIGVLILLLTVLMGQKNKRIMLRNSFIYVLAVYLTYLVAGITLLKIFTITREIVSVANLLYLGIGTLVGFFGLLEIKDFFWYGRWISVGIIPRFISTMENYVNKTGHSPIAAFLFGVFVTLIELPCTGAPYLAILTLLSFSEFTEGIILLLIYNFVFVLPLLVIIILAYTGIKIKRIENWRRTNKRYMRLFIGLFLLGLSGFIAFIVSRQFMVILLLAEVIFVIAMYLAWKFNLIE